MEYTNLDKLILKEDRELRIFLSGGRVRVMRDRDDHGDNFYGEGATLDECLEQTEKNCELMLTYNQGYQDKNHPFTGYMTGAFPDTVIDNGLFNFGTLHIRKINGMVCLIHNPNDMKPVPVIQGRTLREAIDNYNNSLKEIEKPVPYYSELK